MEDDVSHDDGCRCEDCGDRILRASDEAAEEAEAAFTEAVYGHEALPGDRSVPTAAELEKLFKIGPPAV